MFIRFLILFICFFLPLEVFAASVQLKSIVSAVTGDFDNDGTWDRAVLVWHEDEGGVDLYIHTGENEYFFDGIAWSGRLGGMVAKLNLSDDGKVQIVSQNMAVGRHKWSQILTITYVDGEFVPSTLFYESFDGLDPSVEQKCEVDFLEGEAINNSKPFSVPKGVYTLNNWKAGLGFNLCE